MVQVYSITVLNELLTVVASAITTEEGGDCMAPHFRFFNFAQYAGIAFYLKQNHVSYLLTVGVEYKL